MTASAYACRPAWQALRSASSLRTPWAVPLVALLFLLPFAGSAHPVGGPRPDAGPAVVPAAPAAHPQTQAHPRHSAGRSRPSPASREGGTPALCPAYGDGSSQGSGCSDGRHCLQNAVLPNAPAQQAVAAPSRPVVLPPAPVAEPRGPLPGIDRAPDLHQLQVQLT